MEVVERAPDVAGFETFRERLAKRIQKQLPDCPICDNAHWSSPGAAATPATVWDEPTPGTLRTFLVICEQCGYTMQFAESVVNAAS